ncbi:MAG TPA: hypothetical protein DEQ30_02305, partial [Porphyromonadaceae bacterium]|nr:hypothetical protein [Porphyromonadaceae bacterium]
EWSDKLKQLHSIIKKNEYREEAKKLIFELHQMVYVSEMSGIDSTTFEDKLWNDMDEETARKAVNKKGRTVLYGIWHSTRIEDITMNLLVAGTDQIVEKNNWLSKINSPIRHTGNSLNTNEILHLSSLIHIEELKAYRIAVGRNTEHIIRKLSNGEMKRKVCKENLQRILDEKAVENVDSANWLIDFWGRKDVAGIILMPCLRHQLVHLNESMEVKNKKPVRKDQER